MALWAIAAAAFFLLRDPLATLLVFACVVVVLAPLRRAQRAAFFLVAAASLPVWVSAPLPFPGLNHLIVLTSYKISALALLLPLFVYAAPQRLKATSSVSVAGVCLVLYAIYTAFIIWGGNNVTSALRFFIDQCIVLVLPFFALRYAIRSLDDFDACLAAFVIASVLLGAVAIVSSVKVWDFYWLMQPPGTLAVSEYRDGILRINATAHTHSLAFHLAAGLIVLQYLQRRPDLGWLRVNLSRALFLAGMYFTDSRGALGALVISAIAYLVITSKSSLLRRLLIVLSSVGGVLGAIWLLTAQFEAGGRYGSFSYRQELLQTSIAYILQHPLLGDNNFYKSKAFEHLVTGLGNIDITSLYLQVALHYGLIGFTLMFAAVSIPIFGLIRRLTRRKTAAIDKLHTAPAGEDEAWRQAASVPLSILLGWLFLVATTSDIGLTLHLGIVWAALAQVACQLDKRARFGTRDLAPADSGREFPAPAELGAAWRSSNARSS